MRNLSAFVAVAVLQFVSLSIPVQAGSRREAIPLRAGMVIDRSVKIAPGIYLLPSEDEAGQTGAITIQGNDLTVDFAGATLRGTPPETEPDQRKGTAIRVEGRNITLKNLSVHGYKIGLYASNCAGLKLLSGDLSFNWKQHLGSTLEREDESDWMSYHHNESDEWLRYGPGIYLKNCDHFEVKGVTIQGGQCGLMLVNSNQGLAWNNDFSFLSGVGIGLYRSSENRILYNRADWCVRGYSHGVYSRGQDSSGILIYEQSNHNTFAYNSVTHGGDGFFLWAGQTTMDTGQGGCNDNLLYGNDFSYAPANGIEATFSRNQFVNNRMEECDYGVWGGYSYDTLILGNFFANNSHGVAIEHGQNNRIRANTFKQDGEELSLWQNPNQDPNWGYPKHHDTVSHDYEIVDNTILRPRGVTLALKDTRGVTFKGNTVSTLASALKREGECAAFAATDNRLQGAPDRFTGFDAASNQIITTGTEIPPAVWTPTLHRGRSSADLDEIARYEVKPLKGALDPFKGREAWRGRRYILVDEWGPYDFRSPRLWPRSQTPPAVGGSASGSTGDSIDGSTGGSAGGTGSEQRFEILGPSGKWRVKSLRGVASLSAQSGRVPGEITASVAPGKAVDMDIELEYTGSETRDYRGIVTPKGAAVVFGYRKFVASIDWNVRFFVYTQETEPRTHLEAFEKLITTTAPVATVKTDRLLFAGYGGFAPGVPANYFATVADGGVDVPAGKYTLETVSDDGCRVWVDGKRVIDAWKYQVPTRYEATLTLGGKHHIHVEHFQIDGYATIQVDLKPNR